MCPRHFVERVSRSERVSAPRTTRAAGLPEDALVVGAADDHAEREADRVASSVIARLQSGDQDREETAAHHGHAPVARSAAAPGPTPEVGFEGGALSSELSDRINVRRGSGAPLPASVRARMEPAFGGSLADVRVHADGESAALNSAVSARAFTAGQDIFFGHGEYRPDSPEGERVLAHEIAHTRQEGFGARRTTIRRRWDFNQRRLDWTRAKSMRTLKTRFVWFIADSDGDELVVKMEDQPIGLGELAAEMHGSFGTAASVLQQRLGTVDRAWVASLLQQPSIAGGKSWGDYAMNNAGLQAEGMTGPPTAANANDYGRAQALYKLRNSTDDVLAMTKAPGVSAEEFAAPNKGDPSGSSFRARLEQPFHANQLGRIAAVDLFLGNKDRVTEGNMGNWFYDQRGAVTLLDHVDSGTSMAAAFSTANNGAAADAWKDAGTTRGAPSTGYFNPGGAGDMLRKSKLRITAYEALKNMARAALNISKDTGIKGWLDQKIDGNRTRRDEIADHMVEGMQEQRARIIKVFTATRHTPGGSNARAQKKALKASAQARAGDDVGHAKFFGGTNEYYYALKSRAEWLKKNA